MKFINPSETPTNTNELHNTERQILKNKKAPTIKL